MPWVLLYFHLLVLGISQLLSKNETAARSLAQYNTAQKDKISHFHDLKYSY
jgi:hypothetical protein